MAATPFSLRLRFQFISVFVVVCSFVCLLVCVFVFLSKLFSLSFSAFLVSGTVLNSSVLFCLFLDLIYCFLCSHFFVCLCFIYFIKFRRSFQQFYKFCLLFLNLFCFLPFSVRQFQLQFFFHVFNDYDIVVNIVSCYSISFILFSKQEIRLVQAQSLMCVHLFIDYFYGGVFFVFRCIYLNLNLVSKYFYFHISTSVKAQFTSQYFYFLGNNVFI